MKIFVPNFDREGPGVDKNEPVKEGISLFLYILCTKFWDIIKLNMLFILYSIPIITIGPAFGAMTSITMSMVQNKHIFIFSDFHEAFKVNWKQSLISGVISIIFFILLSTSILFYFKLSQNNPKFYIILFTCIFIMILFSFAWLYVYPLLTTVSLSLKDIFKNSLLLSIVCFKNTLIGAVTYGIILGLNVFFFPLTFPLFLFLTFSLLSFISSFTTWAGIKKFIIIDKQHVN
ncbi:MULTISPECIES: DUF624 domain-containing protein [unclassified Clostridium]|uniref:YesL family protein n=1 Tax=unclassified Clostridium TaxID=2614128 RepID=UPI000298064A|nr:MULTISPECIES: DUF624 domain-containing protein [unclassified Clostridium]EKQ56233.1 MAG: putative integral membrane protein [Clostridium sp. Maddingley MBC34-26]